MAAAKRERHQRAPPVESHAKEPLKTRCGNAFVEMLAVHTRYTRPQTGATLLRIETHELEFFSIIEPHAPRFVTA